MYEDRKELAFALEALKFPAGAGVDLSIGKLTPAQDQLSLSLLGFNPNDVISEEGHYVLGYNDNQQAGLIEARRLMGGLIGYPESEVIVHGNSCLTLMKQFIEFRCANQMRDLRARGHTPKIMIPVPGFYKHFSMCAALGIQVEPIPFSEGGVDSDSLMASVDRDPAIMGILCVPKHSNPTGHTYSPEVIGQLSGMAGSAPTGRDFHVFWDNTYAVHDLYPEACKLASLRDAAMGAHSEDYIAVFGTTSKITLASLGIAAVGTSKRIGTGFCRFLNQHTIGDDKLRQLQHVRFFEQTTIEDHMAKHAALVRPAFDGMLDGLEKYLSNESDVRWTRPKGGFFISMWAPERTAMQVNRLCADAGVKLTAAGACFPDGDPHDSHLRITPAMVPLPQIDRVAEIIALSIKLASAEV